MNLIIKILIVCLFAAATGLKAGDPIQFSSPRKSVKTPVDDPVENLLNRPLESFKPGNSLRQDITMEFTPPQPMVIIRKTKEKDEIDAFDPLLKEQNKNQFDYSQPLENQVGNTAAMRKKMTGVEEYLLRQEQKSIADRQNQNIKNSFNSSFDTKNQGYGRDRFNELKGGSQYEQVYGKNQFDPFANNLKHQESLTRRDPFTKTLPGDDNFKSFFEIKNNERAEQIAKERMDDFKRLLGDLPARTQIPGVTPKDAINNLNDLTKRNDNPITITPLDKFSRTTKRDIGGTYDDVIKYRSKSSDIEDNSRGSFFQNRNSASGENVSPEAERERQKPRPLFTPIPRRPF